jgi:hypothetical protein
MNKYLATVRISGQLVKTIVFADSTTHARLLLQYKYGMNSIASSPALVNEVDEGDTALIDSKIPTIKPQPPKSLPQARINSLKQVVARGKDQLNVERERQLKQLEAERKRRQQQRFSLA